jgi:hypothetical protein
MKLGLVKVVALFSAIVLSASDNEQYQSRQGQVREGQQRQATDGRHQVYQGSHEGTSQARQSYSFVPHARAYRPRDVAETDHSRKINPRRYVRRPSFDMRKVQNYFEKRFDLDGDGYLSLSERERMVEYVHKHPDAQ